MRWEDEHYVKLYTRETPTYRSWCWQAKALHPLLMKVMDKAGLLECGDLGRSGVALMTGLPEEVVLPGLKDLERTGTVEWHGGVLMMPKFEEAQEARKSDLLRKRDERQRAKDKARAQALGISQDVSHDVTPRPEVSQPVTLQPDPDPVPVPVPSPETTSVDESSSTGPAAQVFEHWRKVMGKNDGAKFKGKRRRAVEARLREGYSVERLCKAIDGCAKTPHNMGQNDRGERYDDLELICRDSAHVERFERNAEKPPIPGRAGGARFFQAQDADKSSFEKVGVVNGF